MRQISIFLLLTLFIFSCGQLDEATEFDIDYETTFTIPGTIPVEGTDSLSTPEVQTNMEEHFSNYNTEKDLVNEIVLSKLELGIEQPVDGDFSFLNEVKVYIQAGDIKEILLASKSDISNNASNTIELETTSDDLKQYLFEESYQMKVIISTDEAIDQEHEISVSPVFTVDAGLI